MTKNELNNLMIGDKVRRYNDYNILTVVKIKIMSTYNEEDIEICCKSLNGHIVNGKAKNFVVPKKLVKVNKHDGRIAETSMEEILNEDGLYSYGTTGGIERALYNGEKVFSSNAIFRWQ